jgi:hypothetical protein
LKLPLTRASFTEHLDHARQRGVCSGSHIQRFDSHPYLIDPNHLNSSRSQAPHSVIAVNGQLTFTSTGPRRTSIAIVSLLGALDASFTGTNPLTSRALAADASAASP